jgi:hypothetical protein
VRSITRFRDKAASSEPRVNGDAASGYRRFLEEQETRCQERAAYAERERTLRHRPKSTVAFFAERRNLYMFASLAG